MNNLTLNGLDGLMSISILRKVLEDFPKFGLSRYFTTISDNVWKENNNLNCQNTQKALEEKYVFNLISLLQIKHSTDSDISISAAEELKNTLNIIMDRIFDSQNDHDNYLLEIIDDIDHPILKEIVYL